MARLKSRRLRLRSPPVSVYGLKEVCMSRMEMKGLPVTTTFAEGFWTKALDIVRDCPVN